MIKTTLGRAKEADQLTIKGLLGTIQRRAHGDLKDNLAGLGNTFSLGSVNLSSAYFLGITKDSAPKVEAILRKARHDIMAVLAAEMGWKR